MTGVRVSLPSHLRRLAGVQGEVRVELPGPPTPAAVLDELESRYPMLRGTIREHGSKRRRAYIRFLADGHDLSHESPGRLLPESVVSGAEVFHIVGAIAGGREALRS